MNYNNNCSLLCCWNQKRYKNLTDITYNIREFFINHFTSLFTLADLTTQYAEIFRLFQQFLYEDGYCIILKFAGSLRTFRLRNVIINGNHKIIRADIVLPNDIRISSDLFYDKIFVNLKNFKGINDDICQIINDLNEDYNSININRENVDTKHFYIPQGIKTDEDIRYELDVKPARNTSGITVVSPLIANYNHLTDQKKASLKLLSPNKLQKNDYNNDTQNVWLNFEKRFQFLFTLKGIRHNRMQKQTQQGNLEVFNNNFIFEIAENIYYELITIVTNKVNKLTGEKNEVIRTYISDNSSQNNVPKQNNFNNEKNKESE